MIEGAILSFNDPDGYAAAFGDMRVNLTIVGAGDFAARLTRLKLQHVEMYWCRERLPRVADLSFPPEQIVLSFSAGRACCGV